MYEFQTDTSLNYHAIHKQAICMLTKISPSPKLSNDHLQKVGKITAEIIQQTETLQQKKIRPITTDTSSS